MDNYSSKVPIELMPVIGNYVAAVAGLVAVILLIIARKTASLEKKTMMGCMLYITLALIIMGLQQWRQPSTFYVTYEAAHINKEIAELQEERDYLDFLKKYMLGKGMLDGKSVKYMYDRNLISGSEVQEAFNQGLFKEKDRIYLQGKGMVKEETAPNP